MRLSDQLRGLRRTFASARGRVALTLLGIMIGSGSIVLLAGLMASGQQALINIDQGANEADLIQVDREEAPPQDASRAARQLGRGDAELIDGSPTLPTARVSAHNETFGVRATFEDKHKNVTLSAGTPSMLELFRLEVERGRFIGDDDLRQGSHVCVVGINVWRELLDSSLDFATLHINVQGNPWQVIGVLKNKPSIGGNGSGPWMWNNKVIVPESSFDASYNNKHEAENMFVRIGLGDGLDQRKLLARTLIRGTLMRRHFGVENFKVDPNNKEEQQEELILAVIKILLLGTGLLSLLVGGINIMNIMLVTVTERTREIGVRRAVGANPSSVMLQFVLEAGFMALVGGAIGVSGGVLLSWGLAELLNRMLGDWALHIELWSIALGLLLSLVTGVVFGLFPAWRAARLDPVEALRYE